MSTAQNPWPPIGQLFVEQGHLTAAQLEGALVEQEKTGGRLGEILVERGYISRTDLAGALSKQWSWKNHAPRLSELPVALVPPPQASVEPEPVAPAPELVPVSAPPAIDPPPVEAPIVAEVEGPAVLQWQPSPSPTVEESAESSTSSARSRGARTPAPGSASAFAWNTRAARGRRSTPWVARSDARRAFASVCHAQHATRRPDARDRGSASRGRRPGDAARDCSKRPTGLNSVR